MAKQAAGVAPLAARAAAPAASIQLHTHLFTCLRASNLYQTSPNAARTLADRVPMAMQEQLRTAEQRAEVARAKSAQYLRDYADLAGPVLQLAAWITPAGGDCDVSRSLQSSMRSSLASDENCNLSNGRPARLLSPSDAAMALQRGAVGAPPLLRHASMCSGAVTITVICLIGERRSKQERSLSAEWASRRLSPGSNQICLADFAVDSVVHAALQPRPSGSFSFAKHLPHPVQQPI